MTRDHIDINDFTILVEEYDSNIPVSDACSFEEPSIGVAFTVQVMLMFLLNSQTVKSLMIIPKDWCSLFMPMKTYSSYIMFLQTNRYGVLSL